MTSISPFFSFHYSKLELLRTSIMQIQLGETNLLSFEELYRASYYLVLHKHGDKLYSMVEETILHHLNTVVTSLSTSAESDISKSVEFAWTSHQKAMVMIRDILMYMDKNYVPRTTLSTTMELGKLIFYKQILNSSLTNILFEKVLEIIDLSRSVSVSFPSLIFSLLIDPLMDPPVFMPVFLNRTELYYTQAATVKMKEVASLEFILWALNMIELETGRKDTLTCSGLLDIMRRSIIGTSCEYVLQPNFFKLNNQLEIFQLYESTIVLNRVFCADLTVSINQALEQSNVKLIVPSLLSIFSHFNNAYMEMSVKHIFQQLLNEGPVNFSRQLATYIDEQIRNNEFNMSVISVFQFINSKDLFEFYYRSLLARRILGTNDISQDLEFKYIALLRAECGSDYCSKLDAMLLDAGGPKNADFSATVCTAGVWPSMSLFKPLKIPFVMSKSIQNFEASYSKRFAKRRLSWVFTEGWGEVSAIFNDTKYTFCVSTMQMIILSDLQNVGHPEMKRHLISLVRAGILLQEDNTYVVNEQYSSKSRYVRVPQVYDKLIPTPGGDEDTLMEDDRKHLIEACLIRVMKSNRQLHHQNIVDEVMKLVGTRFVPSIALIDGRIENLVDREFIAKDNDDLTLFYYVA